jgi:hypothetical protein
VDGMALRVDDRIYSLGPCPCCGRVEPELEALEPYGVILGRMSAPVLILFQCPCRTSRSLRWEDAPIVLRRKGAPWLQSRRADRTR